MLMKKQVLLSALPFLLLSAFAAGMAAYCLSGIPVVVALSADALVTAAAFFWFARRTENAFAPLDRLRESLARARRIGAAPAPDASQDIVDQVDQVFVGLLKVNADMEGKVTHRVADLEASEVELNKTLALLDSVVEHIPDMIFVKDARELRFVLFNRAGERLLGYNRDELLGKNDYDFFPKEEADFFTGKDRQVLNRGQVVEIDEEPIHTKSGMKILHTKKIPLLNLRGEPEFLLGISEDITARKHSEETIRQKGQQLEKAQEEKDQMELFAYVAAHDLREPIHKVASFGDLLSEHLPAEGPAREYLKRMQSASERMGRLIDDLLRFSKVTKTDVKPERVRLKDIVDDVLQDVDLSEMGATVRTGNLPEIETGRVQVQEVVRNLIANALKFRSPERAPEIEIFAESSSNGSIMVTVKDNGIGFDQSYGERIFRPFERLHSRREFGGTGMGLAICDKIIKQIGGSISAHSSPGQGASFEIVFPASLVRDRPADLASHSRPNR